MKMPYPRMYFPHHIEQYRIKDKQSMSEITVQVHEIKHSITCDKVRLLAGFFLFARQKSYLYYKPGKRFLWLPKSPLKTLKMQILIDASVRFLLNLRN